MILGRSLLRDRNIRSSLFAILATLFAFEPLDAQQFDFAAARTAGSGDAIARVEVVDPGATTGSSYAITFQQVGATLLWALRNTTTQTTLVEQVQLGTSSPLVEGIIVTVDEAPPGIASITEVAYGGTPVDPPVHIYRQGDAQGRGGSNSTGEYAIASIGGLPGLTIGVRRFTLEMREDYEMRFDGDPDGRNAIVYPFQGGEGTLKPAPFSFWSIGPGTPDQTADDRQLIAVGFDDSANPSAYDGGASPPDGGPGTKFDRIYVRDFNADPSGGGDLNRDGVVNYDDVLQDIENEGGDISQDFFSKPYFGERVIGRFSLIHIGGDASYLPPVGTTIRVTTNKPLTVDDAYAFTTPEFGLYTSRVELPFGGVIVGRPRTLTIDVRNNSGSAVQVSSATTTDPSFSVDRTGFSVSAGATVPLAITFDPAQAGEVADTLVLQSDDAVFPEYRIPIRAKAFPAGTGRIGILSQLELPSGNPEIADIWGYVDPTTNREYALIGYGHFEGPPNSGLFVVDVTDPETPVQVGHVETVSGFDVKVWQQYAYVCSGIPNGGLGAIVDLSDPSSPAVVGQMPDAHNIGIDPRGILYLSRTSLGTEAYDLRSDPTSPALVWQNNIQGGHDTAIRGDTLVTFSERAGTQIYDISDPVQPRELSAIFDPSIAYSHSGDLSSDGRYLYICDELSTTPNADIIIWDISNFEDPVRVGEYNDPDAIVHNLYVRGDYAYVSYYNSGFRVFDITSPDTLIVAESYKTGFADGPGFFGAFGCYAYSPSGNIFVSDWPNGLFTFRFDPVATSVREPASLTPDRFALHENYPNPFNPGTTIRFDMPKTAALRITVFDVLGRPVRRLHDGVHPEGQNEISWDGRTDAGLAAGSGIYFIRMESEGFAATRRALLLK